MNIELWVRPNRYCVNHSPIDTVYRYKQISLHHY